MEKLIVKNFGPIKEAEIELTKYVIFIGDTSTGKSTLAKLIGIFKDIYLYRNSNYLTNIKSFLKKYNIDFLNKKTIIEFISDDYFFKISNLEVNCNIVSPDIDLATIESLIEDADITLKTLLDIEKDNNSIIKEVKEIKEQMTKSIRSLEKVKEDVKFLQNYILYIPAERILYSMLSNSIFGMLLNNISLPECYLQFANKFEIARNNIKNKKFNIFNLEYSFENNVDSIAYKKKKTLLSKASSGLQSIIPLLLTIENELKITKYSKDHNAGKIIIIEEPELNLFPNKQKDLINYLAEGINETKSALIITTHSPYILSVLDTLILARNIFNEHPNLKKEINAVVPESYWIDYNGISVYEVRNDGKVYSIKNEEFKSIDTNAIDGASDIISEEFDKLTELRYAQ